ncbi:hypothetical protein U1499_13830 [Aeromonas caviae]|uniref:hypothetical protein n=1 Tax=Aeromonas caviae TaxID=648 RepID=UPI0030147AF2
MQIKEIQVVFNCLDKSTVLSRSETIEGIQRPDQPHNIQLSRLMFESGYMLQIDDDVTVIQKGSFKITYLNDEPDNLVIHGDGGGDEPAGYEGTIEELLQEYSSPITLDDLIRMRTAYTRLMLTLSK